MTRCLRRRCPRRAPRAFQHGRARRHSCRPGTRRPIAKPSRRQGPAHPRVDQHALCLRQQVARRVEVSRSVGEGRGTDKCVGTVLLRSPRQRKARETHCVRVGQRRARHTYGSTEVSDEAHGTRPVAVRQRANVSFAEVCAVAEESIALLVGRRSAEGSQNGTGEVDEERRMTCADVQGFAVAVEFPCGVLPYGLEHPVAVVSGLVDPVPDQALVEKGLERVEVGSGYRLRGRRCAATGEHRKRTQDTLVVSREEPIRPGDRRVKRPLPLLDVAVVGCK